MIDQIDPNAGAWQAAEAAMAAAALDNHVVPEDPGTASLTPDALMAYCQARLSTIDSQMQATFAQQSKANGKLQALNGLMSNLNNTPGGINVQGGLTTHDNTAPAPNDTDTVFNKLDASYDAAIAAVGPNTPMGQQLAADKLALHSDGNGNTDHIVTADEIKSLTQNIQGYTGEINSGAELNMINLQSLMSQRQTAIQLTTNLVQSLGDQMNKVADNIGK